MIIDFYNTSNAGRSSTSKAETTDMVESVFDGAMQSQTSSSSSNGEAIPSVKQSSPIAEGQGIELKDGLSTGEEISNRQKRSLNLMSILAILREVMVLAIHEEITERLKGTDVAIDDFFTTPYEKMDGLKRMLGTVRPMDLMEIPYNTISQRMEGIFTRKEFIDQLVNGHRLPQSFISEFTKQEIDGFVHLVQNHYSEVMKTMATYSYGVDKKFPLPLLPLLQKLNFNEAGRVAIIENYESMLNYNKYDLSNIFKLYYECQHKQQLPYFFKEALGISFDTLFLRAKFFVACAVNEWDEAKTYFNELINNQNLRSQGRVSKENLAYGSMELVFKYNTDKSDEFFNSLFGEIKRLGLMPSLFESTSRIAGIVPAIKHSHHVAIGMLLSELKSLEVEQGLNYLEVLQCPGDHKSLSIFENALKKKDVNIVKLFLNKVEANRLRGVLENNNHVIFKAAARLSSKEVINYLFDVTYRLGNEIGKEVQITVLQDTDILLSAIEHNNKEAVDTLFERARAFEHIRPMIIRTFFPSFMDAVNRGYHEIVATFLEEAKGRNEGLAPLRHHLLSNNDYEAFRSAVQGCHVEVVKILVDSSKEYRLLPSMLEADGYGAFEIFNHYVNNRNYYKKNYIKMMKFLWGEVGQLKEGKTLQLSMLKAKDYSMFHIAGGVGIEAVKFLWNKAEEFEKDVQREMLQSSGYRALRMAFANGDLKDLKFIWDKAEEFGAERERIKLEMLRNFANGNLLLCKDYESLKFILDKAEEFRVESMEMQLAVSEKLASLPHQDEYSKSMLGKAERLAADRRGMQLEILEKYAVTMIRKDPKNFKFIWDKAGELGGEFGSEAQLKLLRDNASLIQALDPSAMEYLWNTIKEFEENIQREMLERGHYVIFLKSLECNVELVKSILDRAQELGIEQGDMLKYNEFDLAQLGEAYFPFCTAIENGNFEVTNLLIDRAHEHGVLQGALESSYEVFGYKRKSMFFEIIMQQRFSPEEQMSLLERVVPHLSVEKAVDLYDALGQSISVIDIEHCLRVAIITENEKVFKWMKDFVTKAGLQKRIGLYDQDLKEALAQTRGCTISKKKREAGLKCIDSQEEEEITEEEKNKRIKEVFNINDAISRTNNIEFYGELLEFSQRASEDLSIDLDVEQRFIEKVKGINLDSLDPEIKDIIGELKEQIENKEETKNIFKRPGAVEKIKRVAEGAGLTNTVFLDKKGRFQDFINTVNSNPKVMNHLGRVGRVSGWAMQGMMYKNLMGDLLSGNKEGVAINLGFIAGNPLLSKMAEAASARGLGLVSEGKVLLGQGLRMASPFLARVPSAFVIYDLVNQVKALKAGNQDALVGVIGDSIYIGVDVAEIGIEVAEIAGLLEGVSSVTGPIGAAIGAVIFIGTDIYMAVKTVEAEDKIIHLTGGEKFTEGLRAFLHMKMEESLEKLMKEKQANNELVKNAIKFLKDHTDIEKYVFPTGKLVDTNCRIISHTCYYSSRREVTNLGYSGSCYDIPCPPRENYGLYHCQDNTKCDKKIELDQDNTVYLDKKKTNIRLSRTRPDKPEGGELFCLPSAPLQLGGNENTYHCFNAIGLSYSVGRTGNHTLIALGQGRDVAVGFKDSPHILLVENGDKDFGGGDKDDIFILQGDNISGKLDGSGGNNTIDLVNFSQNAHQLVIDLVEGLRGYGKIEISPSNTLEIKNMNIIKARKGKKDIIKCNYNTRYVDGGGGENKDNPDVIDVFEPDDNMQLVVRPYTTINNSAYSKNFTYTIFPDMEGSAQVNLLANYHHKTHNDFIFNSTIADLKNINIQNIEDINLNIAGSGDIYRDVYTVKNITFSSLLPSSNKVFNLTISDIPANSNYIFNDSTQMKVGKHGNLYALQNTDKPIEEIVRDYPAIANRLNMTITVQSNNETVIVGHGKHEVLYNNPLLKSYLIGNGGEDIYVITLDEQKFWDSSFSEIGIYNVDGDSTYSTIDLRNVVKILKNVLETQVDLPEVLQDGHDLLIKLRIKVEQNTLEKILKGNNLKDILKFIFKNGSLEQHTMRDILKRYSLQRLGNQGGRNDLKNTLREALEKGNLDENLESIFQHISGESILRGILQDGLVIRVKDGLFFYQKLHIFVNNVPMKFNSIDYRDYRDSNDKVDHRITWMLKPSPLTFDKKVKTIAITTNDIEKESEIIIQKQAGNYTFMRLRNDLVVMNDHSLGESNLCTVILSNFYQEPKMQTLSIKFNDVKISLQDEKDKIENAMAFCHQGLKINNILSINDINSYDCFTFDSNKVLFLKSENDLMLLSDRGTLLISDYYSSTHNNLGLSIKLNDQTIKPEEFKSKADNPSAFKYYKPNNEQGLQIYHNQPENKHQIGLVDLKDKSTLDCDMRVIGDSLIVSSGGNTIVKVENWSYSSEAKEMIFAFSDALISNAKDIVEEFQQEKNRVGSKKAPVTHRIRHKRHKHHRNHNSQERLRRSVGIEDAVSKEESLEVEREGVPISASSSGARQGSWLNSGAALVKRFIVGSVYGVVDRVKSVVSSVSTEDRVNLPSMEGNIQFGYDTGYSIKDKTCQHEGIGSNRQQGLTVGFSDFLSHENTLLLHCTADAMDKHPIKRYQELKNKGVEVVPSTDDVAIEPGVSHAFKEFKREIKNEIKKAKPEIIASLIRGKKYRGNVGLDDVLHKCKERFSELLPKLITGKYESYEIDKTLPFNVTVSNPDEQFEKAQMWVRKTELLKKQKNTLRPATGLNDISITMSSTQVMEI
ncbi:hypothetical protein [Candidatus Mesenet endosymbiont of Phosphuga atrata]|uniref:hypothetical protein n=1 Tax=Candidatus Mesenet endosymbiont of Phosphuga atrata TaxID=3066221 RepID=UPI0030CB04B9